MKSLLKLFLALFVATSFGCTGQPADLSEFNILIYKPRYASGFEIVGAQNYKSTIIRVKTPWQGASNVESSLFIARNGEVPPKGFTGQILKENAEKFICMSSSHVAMLDAIECESGIVAISGLDFTHNEWVAEHKDEIQDIGYDNNINHEKIIVSAPDLVLLYGILGINSIESKLKELNIPFIYIAEYVEDNPLAKAEWLVAVAETAGKREEGIEYFKRIPAEYMAIKERVANAKSANPTVMLNAPYGENWFMPSSYSYIIRLVTDAGGKYVYTKNNSGTSMPIDTEEAIILAEASDCWINVSPISSMSEFRKALPKFTDISCVKRGEVYNNSRRETPGGGNDFWESGVINPHIILRDLVKIFHPELVQEEFYYYKRLE